MVHATTLFTNALIERKGARTGLLTTAGFADALEIGRERKYELYDINIERPSPLVPRHLRLEVPERMSADGSVRKPLDARALIARAADLARAGVASVAIVFLHAYANPRHEAEAARLVGAQFPDIHVSTSHEVAPEIREFERASTTVANAFIKPLAQRYLALMAERLAGQGIPAPLLLMLSSGGLTHVAEAQRTPVQMLESGPAAGAIAAAFFGNEDSGGKLVAFDMGGTTAKLSLVDEGEPLTAYSFEAARQRRFVEGSGLPIRISTIELIEIGAGGGSIAHVDEIGLLKVGPQSAGSQPGPPPTGSAGPRPPSPTPISSSATSTPTISRAAPCGSTSKPPGRRWGASPNAWASRSSRWRGASTTSSTRTWRGRPVSNRRARPRSARVRLLATGGAGPVHAYSVARKIGLRRVICPPSAGVASALGLLVAPARVDRVATVGIRLDRGNCAELETAFRRLEDEARAILADSGVELGAATFQRLADGRFLGQGFDLVVRLPPGPYDGPERRVRAGRSAPPSRRPTARSSPSHLPAWPWSSSTFAWRRARRWRAARSPSTAAPARVATPSRAGVQPISARPVASWRPRSTTARGSRRPGIQRPRGRGGGRVDARHRARRARARGSHRQRDRVLARSVAKRIGDWSIHTHAGQR